MLLRVREIIILLYLKRVNTLSFYMAIDKQAAYIFYFCIKAVVIYFLFLFTIYLGIKRSKWSLTNSIFEFWIRKLGY